MAQEFLDLSVQGAALVDCDFDCGCWITVRILGGLDGPELRTGTGCGAEVTEQMPEVAGHIVDVTEERLQ